MLDEVEHHGRDYSIERRGRIVATLVPTQPWGRRTTWGELMERMKNAPSADPKFASDLRRIRREAGKEDRESAWERYSTRRSSSK
ncbi:MAG: hypothetical protein HY071_01190 [Chloroflexi bacterium]|nr:hypothetical protein [Chloroflexota bacterium]